jgi:hypothetical protein
MQLNSATLSPNAIGWMGWDGMGMDWMGMGMDWIGLIGMGMDWMGLD